MGVVNYETETVNWGNAVPGQEQFFYHFPNYGDANDTMGYIAAPGRFPLDLTTLRTAANEGWVDVGANLMEMTEAEPANNIFCDYSVQGPGEVTSTSCAYTEPSTGVVQYGVLRVTTGLGRSVWEGGSWEGHGSFQTASAVPFKREWYLGANQFSLATQYGKTGFRCVYE